MKFNPSNYSLHWVIVLAIIITLSSKKNPGVMTNKDLVMRQDFLKDILKYLEGESGMIVTMAREMLTRQIADIEFLLQIKVVCAGII